LVGAKVKQIHPELKPGAFIVIRKPMRSIYTDVHGKEHIFLKDQADVQSIVAVEDTEDAALGAIGTATVAAGAVTAALVEAATTVTSLGGMGSAYKKSKK